MNKVKKKISKEITPPIEAAVPAADISLHPIAENLLIPLWRAIPKAYKMKYARSIWEQFESNIKNAAATSDPSRFLGNFCSRLGASILTEDVARVAAFIATEDPRSLLRALRVETTLLVLHVRVVNEKRKEQWMKESEEALNGDV